MNRLTRLSYNSMQWRQPTGEAAEYEIGETYNQQHGFGHEDWLFRDEWVIDGWRYGFIQGVGKSYAKLLKDASPFTVTLFTIQPDKRRRFVARIEDAECLSDQQADEALAEFRRRGWLDMMKQEIVRIGGNQEALGDIRWARNILNVRFRLSNVRHFSNDEFITSDDPAIRLNRYMLYKESTVYQGEEVRLKKRLGSLLPPNIQSHTRSGSNETEVCPEHAMMQARLMAELKIEYPGALVVREANFVDVLVETPTDVMLFEIKSDLSTKTVLRHALGQLLEYAYHTPRTDTRKLKLVAVGRNRLTDVDAAYLQYLKKEFNLPLDYRAVPI